MSGDTAAVRALLTQHADVNAVQADGATALHWAVYREDLDTANLLIRAGANVKAANREGMTPLALACLNGNAALIETLLTAGADVNGRMLNGETPLMMASRTGNVRGDEGAARPRGGREREGSHPRDDGVDVGRGPGPFGRHPAPDRTRSEPRCPLESRLARQDRELCQSRRPEAIEEKGERVRRPQTAGHVGSQWRGADGVGVCGAANDLESVRTLLAAGADVNQVTGYGWSPLLVATQNRYYQLGAFLLDKGADPNIANKGGWTPLYLAVDNRNIEGGDYPVRKGDMDHLDFIKKLLDHGADVNARMKNTTEGRTVFTLSVGA